jgi:hypothetical protein
MGLLKDGYDIVLELTKALAKPFKAITRIPFIDDTIEEGETHLFESRSGPPGRQTRKPKARSCS